MMSLDLTSNFLQFGLNMAKVNDHTVYEFDHFRVDTANLMLYNGDVEVPLPPKVIKTLAVLVGQSGEILSKDDLMKRVWADSVVEESNLSQYLYLLRKTLGDRPDGREYIETLRRRGYRFNGEVRLVEPNPPRNGISNGFPNIAPSGDVAVERRGNVLRLVEKAPDSKHHPQVVPADIPTNNEIVGTPKRRGYLLPIAGLLMASVIGGLIVLFVFQKLGVNGGSANPNEMSVSRLTNGVWPMSAAISRDGKYFVYTETSGENSKMWLQTVGESHRICVADSSDKVFGLKTFSPDGRSIYYSANEKRTPGRWDLYRMPAIGGPSVKILDNVQTVSSFSPSGEEVAFFRKDESSGTSSLMIADNEGRKERTLLTRTAPYFLAATPAWSPDGSTLIFAEFGPDQSNTTNRDRLYAFDVSTRKVKDASPENWDTIHRIEWTRDGTGFVVIGTRENDSYTTRRDQVYFISFPDGVSRRITTDGIRHEPGSLGVTDSGSIMALASNRSAQIWSMSSNGDAATAEQLSKGLYDGRPGLAPMPDGRLGFITYTSDDPAIWIMNSNGSDMIQLTSAPLVVEELRSDPTGHYFVFSAMKDRHSHLYRIDPDGNNLKQLTFGNGSEIDSAVSPDGKWLAYGSASPETSYLSQLYRSTIDGETATPFGKNECSRPSYSPDGKYLSCITDDDKHILIISVADGSEVKTIDIPMYSIVNFGVRWTPDSSAVVFIRGDQGGSNLWLQPINGEGARQLTNFPGGTIFRFTYSTDGSRIYLARGFPIQDVILIKNFR